MCIAAAAQPAATKKDPNEVHVTSDQLHQIEITAAQIWSASPMRTAVGQIAFNDDKTTNVFTPFSGRVTKVIAKIGDRIEAGDPLFEIDSPEVMQAQTDVIVAGQNVEKMKAQLALAKRVLDRLTSLFSGNATSQRELDQARSDHASAAADLDAAQIALDAARNKLRVILDGQPEQAARAEKERLLRPRLIVRAPIGGTVIARKIGPGQYVRADAGEPLYTIVDMSTMWLKAFVPESEIANVREGQDIEVRVSALPDRLFKAKVTSIAASSDPQTRRIAVRSELPNVDGVLRAEMFATFRLAIGAKEVGPSVPSRALIREGDRSIIWVEEAPMKFRRREVKAGIEQGGRILIREGIAAGEKVVARGAIFVDNEAGQ